MTEWLQGRAARILIILLTLWGVATALPDLDRFIHPLGAFGFSADNDGVITDIWAPFGDPAHSPAGQAGLRVGDRLDLHHMNCWHPESRVCRDTLAVMAGLGGLTYGPNGMSVGLRVLRHGEPPRDITVTAIPPPFSGTRSVVLLADQLLSLVLVLGAAMLVWRRPSRTAWGFFLFALWSQPAQVTGLLAMLLHWPPAVLILETGVALIQAGGIIGFVLLILCFPRDETSPRWRLLERCLPILALVFAIAQLVSFANVLGLQTETLTDAVFLGLVVIDIAALAILIARRWEMAPVEYQRLRWVTAGCAIGLPAFIFAKISQSTTLLTLIWGGAQPDDTTIGLLLLCNCLLAWFVGIAIWRRRVENVWIPIRRGTTLAAVTAVVAVPVVYVHDTIVHYQHQLGIPELVWALVAAPGILLIMHKAHELIVHVTDHLLHYAYFHAQHRFKGASDALRAAGSEAAVDELLVHVPMDALDLAAAAVFREIGGTFTRVASEGWSEATTQRLDPAQDAAVFACLAHHEVQRLPPGHWKRADIPTGMATPVLVVPILADGQAVAVALYGGRLNGTALDHDERQMLYHFARHAAISYQRVDIEILRREVAILRDRLGETGIPA